MGQREHLEPKLECGGVTVVGKVREEKETEDQRETTVNASTFSE